MTVKRLIPVTGQARGTFDVQLHPLAVEEIPKDAMVGRMSIDKQFHGELDATSQGQMLTAGTLTTGSAVYVAIERVSGALGGKKGSFTLHHVGTMTRGAQTLTIAVVPDSGTEELAGISGVMKIDIDDGRHSYTFDYSLG